MKVKYQGEEWNVYDNDGNSNYFLAKRVVPRYIDIDPTTCEVISMDRETYIPKKDCVVLN